MGITAAVGLGAAALGAAGAGWASPKPPKPPKAPVMQDPAPDVQAAAERQRKKNSAAYGRSDTILTGPAGTLGSMPSGNAPAAKTILGG